MKSWRCIALAFGLMATQGFAAAPLNAKSGSGVQSSSGGSSSGASAIVAGGGVGSGSSGTVTVGGRGSPTGLESQGPSGPSHGAGPNRDIESARAFGGSIGGPLGFGSSWGSRPPNEWFYGFGGNSQGGRRSLGSQVAFPEQSEFDGLEGHLGQLEGLNYLSGQSGQDGEFDIVLGGLESQGDLENLSGSRNMGGLGAQRGHGALPETSSFSRGLLNAMSGLSNLRSAEGDSEGLGQVFGSRRSAGFRQRFLSFLPPRSRSLARQYYIYRKNGGRGGFIHFLRKRRLGTLSNLGGAQTGSLRGTPGSSREAAINNLGEEQFIYWPRHLSQGRYGGSFGSNPGFTGGFGDIDDSFPQQSI